MRAAQHHRVHAHIADFFAHARKVFVHLRAVHHAALHHVHKPRARHGQCVAAVFAHQPLEFVKAECKRRGHYDHLAAVCARAGGLERRLHRHNRHVQPLAYQRRGRRRRCIARDYQRLYAPVQQLFDHVPRQHADFAAALFAVRRVCAVAKVYKVLVRHKRAQIAQHRYAAHAAVEHAHRRIAARAIVTYNHL